MDASLDPALVRLRKGAVRSHVGVPGRGIAVFEGRVWLTQHDDRRDVVLDAGETFSFDRRGRIVVEALSDASMLFFDNADDANVTDAESVLAPAPAAGTEPMPELLATVDGRRVGAPMRETSTSVDARS